MTNSKGFAPDRPGPLAGTRIVDLTRLAAGNMVTHMLADFGAEVIKIERPGVGDDLRRFGEAETWWKVYARSKKSMVLNLKQEQGRELLLSLVEKCDMLVENYLPGTLEKWGLGPEQLWQRQPGLIIVRISGWGQTGPYAHKPGFGTLIEAMSGYAAMTGHADGPPLLPPLALADMVAGLSGFGAAVVALLAREQGKAQGQVIDLSLFEPLFSILGPWTTIYAATGKVPRRQGNRTDVSSPRNVYTCADGRYLALSASMQSMWEKLAGSIGRADLITDERFTGNLDRVRNAPALDAILADFIGARTLAQNLEHFDAAGITVGPICDPSDLLDHEYIRGRGVLVDVQDDDLGTIPMHAVFPRLSQTPGTIRSAAPTLGQHTDEVLDLLGLSLEQRDLLKQKGII